MTSLLLVESGSSKTDWCFISPNQESKRYQTSGLNPYHRSEKDCHRVLKEELHLTQEFLDIDLKIIFYGAGVKQEDKAQIIRKVLHQHFETEAIEIHTDLLAAAKATCGNDKGMVCILGTGSNSGYYNGEEIAHQNPSLGYIIGDEGSGTFLGKKVLQYYYYNTFDEELRAAFESKFSPNLSEILHKVYQEPMGNRYLASFALFLKENRNHFMVENILEDAFIDFHQRHILKYRQSWQHPIHFVGSIAFEFRDVLLNLQEQYGLETGKIIKSPLSGLIAYHQEQWSTASKD